MHFSFDINWVVWCRGYLYYFLRKLNRKIWIGYPIYRQWVSDPVGESVCLSELGFCSIYIFTVRCHSVQATRLELWIYSIWQISITSSCFPPAYHDVDKDSDICTILVQRRTQHHCVRTWQQPLLICEWRMGSRTATSSDLRFLLISLFTFFKR